MSAGRKLVYLAAGLGTGGTERHLVRLAAGVAARGWRPLVLNAGEAGRAADRLAEAGVPVDVIPAPVSIREVGTFLRLVGRLRREKPDIVHSYLYGAHWLDALATRWAGAPYVDSRRNLVHWRPGPASARERLRGRLSTAVVANSEAAARQALDDGAPESSLTVIPNGVPVPTDEVSRLGAGRERARRRLGLARDSRVVGSVGSLKAIKAPQRLVQAFAQRRDVRPSDRLVLVGDGPLRQQLVSLAAELGVGRALVLAGACNEPADLLPAFDVFAVSSLTEGFSNAVIEAMAAGLPVVATAVGGNVEAVVPGGTGLLVPPDDTAALAAALDAVFALDDAGAMWGRRGRARVRELYSLERMIEAHLQVYEGILALERVA